MPYPSQSAGGTATFSYDNAGNMLTDGAASYTYSDRGRMASASIGVNTVAYKYNGLDQRVSKTGPTAVVPSGAAYYAYDEAGQLIGEYDASVKPGFETIYLGTTPVAVLKQTGSASNSTLQVVGYNVWADHLDTPRVVTRSNDQAIVWRWDSAEAFGATAPNQNPNALGVFSYNQRFPGQLVDLETGGFYNWHLDYRAGVGTVCAVGSDWAQWRDQYVQLCRRQPDFDCGPGGIEGGDRPAEAMCLAMGNHPIACQQVRREYHPEGGTCNPFSAGMQAKSVALLGIVEVNYVTKVGGASSLYVGIRPGLGIGTFTEGYVAGGSMSGLTIKASVGAGLGAYAQGSAAISFGAGGGASGSGGLGMRTDCFYGIAPPSPGIGWTFPLSSGNSGGSCTCAAR